MTNTASDQQNALGLSERTESLRGAEAHAEVVSLVENPTDGEVAAFMMGVSIADAPHQLVAAHEAEVWAMGGAFDDDADEIELGGEG